MEKNDSPKWIQVECVYSWKKQVLFGRTGISHFVVHLAKVRNVVPPNWPVQKSEICLASPCRHARKATVFANFGDSWLASSSCTQAAAEDAGPALNSRYVNVSDYGERTARCLLMLFESIWLYSYVICIHFHVCSLSWASKNNIIHLFCFRCFVYLTALLNCQRARHLNCSRLTQTAGWDDTQSSHSRTMHPFFVAWIRKWGCLKIGYIPNEIAI